MTRTTKSQPVALIRDARPAVRIATTPNAPAAEEYAAEELRLHLWRMATGGAVGGGRSEAGGPAIFVNDREAAEDAGIAVARLALGPEMFHLETRGGNLYLLGGGPRGVLYGVYELLEQAGCRWFTSDVSRIPRYADLNVSPFRKTGKPAFEFRDMWIWEGKDPAWWVRNRLNGWYTPVPEYMGGHVTYGMFVHTFYVLVPPQEFFATHPEYFSLVGGKRTKDNSQLCLTHPDVLRIVTDRVLKSMRDNPRATIFSVSQNDGGPGYCECPRCQAVVKAEGSQSGPILRFANAVAARTAKVFPDKLIDTLAYSYSLDTPKHVVPHPNVRVRLCSICCCQGHGYGTCDHPESARFLRALTGWSRRTQQMYIWHYCTNFTHYPLPMPDFDELHANINLYRRFGVYGLFMQGGGEEGGGAESMALRGYVLGKLMWDPTQPIWPLVDDFLAAYYGPAARHVRRYLDVFHDRVRRDRNLHPSLYDPPSHPLFETGPLVEADRALAKGQRCAVGAARLRVRLLRNGLTYARNCRASFFYRQESHDLRAVSDECDPPAAVRTMIRTWSQAGVRRIHEGFPLDTTVQRLAFKCRNYRKKHPLLWLRDGDQAIALVPSLGGRLWAWEAHGRQWLAQSDSDDHWNGDRMTEGYVEFVFPAMCLGWRGWFEPCRIRQCGAEVRLDWRELPSGLAMSRRMAFKNGALNVITRVENRDPEKNQYCAWGVGLHLTLPRRGSTRIRYVSRGGKTGRLGWAELPDGLSAARYLYGQDTPASGWQIDMPGCRLVHDFHCEPMGLVMIGKAADQRLLALAVRTDNVLLAPGKGIDVTQTIRFEKTLAGRDKR